METVSVAVQKGWTFTAPGMLHEISCRRVNDLHVLTIDGIAMNAESFGARDHLAGGGLAVIGIFVVLIILANIDHRQFPERGHVHRLVKQSLSQSAVAKKADRHLIGSTH